MLVTSQENIVQGEAPSFSEEREARAGGQGRWRRVSRFYAAIARLLVDTYNYYYERFATMHETTRLAHR